MVYYLPAGNTENNERQGEVATPEEVQPNLADLRVFWGPEICRLEYLVHLMATGRIKDLYNADIGALDR